MTSITDETWQSPRVLALTSFVHEDDDEAPAKGFGELFSTHAIRQRESREKAIARLRGSASVQRPAVAFGSNATADIDFRFEIPATSILKRQVLNASKRPEKLDGSSPPRAASTTPTLSKENLSSSNNDSHNRSRNRPTSAMSIYATHTDARAVVDTVGQERAAEALGVTVTRVPSRVTVQYDRYGERIRHGPRPETFKFPNSFFTYHGTFEHNIKNGEGRLTMGDGGSYVGEFKDGEICGQGVRSWPDGTTYRGAFVQGELHGFGIFQSGSSTYEGEFCRNVRHGTGTLRQPHVTYVGDFVDHKFHGYGVLKSAPKSVSGHFVRGLLQGTARVKYANGDTFVGDYFEDCEHGQGTFFSAATKVIYTGQMVHGARAFIPNTVILRELRALDQPLQQLTVASLASPMAMSQQMAGLSMGFRMANARLSVSVLSPKAAKAAVETENGSSDDDDDRASTDSKNTTLAVSIAPKSLVAKYAPSPVVSADGNYNVALAWGRPFPVKAGKRFEIAVVAALVSDEQYVTPPPRWPVGSTMGALPSNAMLMNSVTSPKSGTPATPSASRNGPPAGSVRGAPGAQRGTATSVASVTLSTVRYGLFTMGEAQPYETGRQVTLEMYAINPKRKDALGILASELMKSQSALPSDLVYHPNEAHFGGPEAFSCLASRQALIDASNVDPATATYVDHILADVALQKKDAAKKAAVGSGTTPQPLTSVSPAIASQSTTVPVPRLAGVGRHMSWSCANLSDAMANSVTKFRMELFAPTPRSFTTPDGASPDGSQLITGPEAGMIPDSSALPDAPEATDVVLMEMEKGVAKFRVWLSSQAPVGEYLAVVRFKTNVVAPRPNGGTVETNVRPLLLPFYVTKCV